MERISQKPKFRSGKTAAPILFKLFMMMGKPYAEVTDLFQEFMHVLSSSEIGDTLLVHQGRG